MRQLWEPASLCFFSGGRCRGRGPWVEHRRERCRSEPCRGTTEEVSPGEQIRIFSAAVHSLSLRDDCVEIFLDTNHDYRSYHQLLINSLATMHDRYNDGTNRLGDKGWNGTYELAARVEPTFWTVEIEIPAAQLDGAHIQRGDVWGFNVARVRIANASEYGQWVPTYGFAHRPDRFGFLLFD